ncbi:MAG: hypothetical protein HOE44_03915 [Candidatus Marinimicrobia bacterium]|nr:hypothetical protein [Candidatus Neomarinimicrobiota bacterium]MBT7831148.1 hypothetical protein [Candidatus Neomarinimicrobiota bacterium]
MKLYLKWVKAALTIIIALPLYQSTAYSAVSELMIDEGRITAHFKGYPLKQGLEEIAQQSGITFLIDPDVDGRLNFRMEKAPLTLGIRRLLSKYNHVIMQGKDEKGRLTPKLVRILRKGEMTASRFDVIKAGGKDKTAAPEGGYRNYRQLLPKPMARPGRVMPSPSVSPAKQRREWGQLRTKEIELQQKIKGNRESRTARCSVVQQQIGQLNANNSLQELDSLRKLTEMADNLGCDSSSLSSPGPARGQPNLSDRHFPKPEPEIPGYADILEKQHLDERQENTHKKPSGNSVKINLFPGQGDKVLD